MHLHVVLFAFAPSYVPPTLGGVVQGNGDGYFYYKGDNPDDYSWQTSAYEAKTPASNFVDLVKLIASFQYYCAYDESAFNGINNILLVDMWLRALIVEIAAGNEGKRSASINTPEHDYGGSFFLACT